MATISSPGIGSGLDVKSIVSQLVTLEKGPLDKLKIDDPLLEETARRIARQRASAEGRDGVAAFLDKRPPAWLADQPGT